MNTKIMYLEIKSDGLRGEGRIGRVRLSKTGKTLYYGERTLVPTKGSPLKANYFDQETLEDQEEHQCPPVHLPEKLSGQARAALQTAS